MSISRFAPIAVSTYVRLDHLKRTVSALARNTLATQSDVYFLSDAARPGDEEKVKAVRRYLETVDGFRSVHILQRERNDRIANNRGGLRHLLENFGKAIFLEEDVVTMPGFLQFINQGLDFYYDEPRVTSICGHTPCLLSLAGMEIDYYFMKRFHPWGFGITLSAFEKAEYLDANFLRNYRNQLKPSFDRYGSDLWQMMKNEASGKVDALDLKICFHQIVNGTYSLLPTQSLVKNIGLDGTGMHCDTFDPYFGDKLNSRTVFTLGAIRETPDSVLDEYQRFYHRPGFAGRWLRRMRSRLVSSTVQHTLE